MASSSFHFEKLFLLYWKSGKVANVIIHADEIVWHCSGKY